MLTAKQIEFCKGVADGKNATQAYMAAFKSKNASTSKAAASRLLKGAVIKDKIKELQALAKDIVSKSQKETVDKATLKEVMDINERMSILTQIARGEIPLKKPMVVSVGAGGGSIIEEVEVVPDWMDRKNAIAELNKMDGSYAATKIDATVGGVKSIIIERASKTKG